MTHGSGRASEASVDSDVSLLSINQKVSAVAAGSLDSLGVSDILMVGTQTNLLAYDVQNNTDVFYKDVSGSCCRTGRGLFSVQTHLESDAVFTLLGLVVSQDEFGEIAAWFHSEK